MVSAKFVLAHVYDVLQNTCSDAEAACSLLPVTKQYPNLLKHVKIYAVYALKQTHTCMTCSNLPAVLLKQYSVESSPKQYRNSPRGEVTAYTKSPPSRFPDWKDLTTRPGVGGGRWGRDST